MDYPVGIIRTDSGPWHFQDTSRHPRPRRKDSLKNGVSDTVRAGCCWERGHFTVPAGTTNEALSRAAPWYMNRFGHQLEAQGFTVLKMTPPVLDLSPMPIAPDRRRYLLMALCRRRPQEIVYDIPDAQVPAMLELGLRLKE